MLVSCLKFVRFTMPILSTIAAIFCAAPCFAQNRVDLDDLTIKGELLNDNRLRMSARESQKITDRVSYRENFRKEATDGLEVVWPDQEAAGASAGTGASGGGQ